jgi:hypothetical protein
MHATLSPTMKATRSDQAVSFSWQPREVEVQPRPVSFHVSWENWCQGKSKTIQTRDGYRILYDEYFGWKAKGAIDQIDRVLGQHFGLTDEEMDFIINYDIKYRMGHDAREEWDD